MLFSVYIVVFCSFLVRFHTNVNGYSCAYESSCPYTSTPEQLRVAIQGQNTVSISWRTNGTLNGSNDTLIPQVAYSTNKNMSNSIISNGTSSTYANLGIVSWFHVCILNVNTSTKYYYRIQASLCVNESEIHSFTSQPVSGDSNPININIVGDLGFDNLWNVYSASQTINALANAMNNTNLYLHVGDISYADDFFLAPFKWNASYEFLWNKFQHDMEVVTADKFYMTAPGNHEVTCLIDDDDYCRGDPILNQYRNFSAYLHRFSMPGNESEGSYRNLWYSFDYGPVHFVIINTETDYPNASSGPDSTQRGGNFAPNGTQLRWLKADLKFADGNRCKVPWIIVSGHRPWYGSIPSYNRIEKRSDNCKECRDAFAEIIFDNNVDFYFSGHVHWYERLFPVDRYGNFLAQNYNNQPGPIYITTGAGGAPEPPQTINITANASAFYLPTFGYSRLEIKNASYCQLSFVDSYTGQSDLVNITRHHSCKQCLI